MKRVIAAVILGASIMCSVAAGIPGKEEEPVKMLRLHMRTAVYELYTDMDGILYVKSQGVTRMMRNSAGEPMTYEQGKENWG